MLKEFKPLEYNISTLEDPVEYNMPFVNQSQVKPEIGYDFAAGLRSMMRQDPDIIMVGEIRDRETAMLAIEAALTGHMVFSTIHTNSAAATVQRLVNMGYHSNPLAQTHGHLGLRLLLLHLHSFLQEESLLHRVTLH